VGHSPGFFDLAGPAAFPDEAPPNDDTTAMTPKIFANHGRHNIPVCPPAPTGFFTSTSMVYALWVGRPHGSAVLLRIVDHDRPQRSRPVFEVNGRDFRGKDLVCSVPGSLHRRPPPSEQLERRRILFTSARDGLTRQQLVSWV
jgi:hypothetical protein